MVVGCMLWLRRQCPSKKTMFTKRFRSCRMAATSVVLPFQVRLYHRCMDSVGDASHASFRVCSNMLTACYSAVPENPVTLQPASAAYIARGFVDWLAERTGKPADQLRVSVSRWTMSSHGGCRILPRYDVDQTTATAGRHSVEQCLHRARLCCS